VVAAANGAVRLIVRRPAAYAFAKQYPGVPIPGLVRLDLDGKLVGSVALKATTEAKAIVELLTR